jgi:hypothetical protein
LLERLAGNADANQQPKLAGKLSIGSETHSFSRTEKDWDIEILVYNSDSTLIFI